MRIGLPHFVEPATRFEPYLVGCTPEDRRERCSVNRFAVGTREEQTLGPFAKSLQMECRRVGDDCWEGHHSIRCTAFHRAEPGLPIHGPDELPVDCDGPSQKVNAIHCDSQCLRQSQPGARTANDQCAMPLRHQIRQLTHLCNCQGGNLRLGFSGSLTSTQGVVVMILSLIASLNTEAASRWMLSTVEGAKNSAIDFTKKI